MAITQYVKDWERPKPEDHLTKTAKDIWLYVYNDHLNRRPPKIEYIDPQKIADDLNISIEAVDSVRAELEEISFVTSQSADQFSKDGTSPITYSGRLMLEGSGLDAGTRYYRKLKEERKEWFRHPICVAVIAAILTIIVSLVTARWTTSDLDDRVKQIEERLSSIGDPIPAENRNP